MKLKFRAVALAAGILFLTTGVVSSDEKTEDAPPVQSDAVSLKLGTWSDIEALVKVHKGKVVVVDIWSTSCLPCMTEFPNLVDMHNAHKDKVVCVSFNVDYAGIKKKPAESYRPRVEDFLKKQKAVFTNFLSTVESDKVFETLELSSIPAVYVYDADGKLAKRFDGSLLEDGEEEAFTYEKDINPFVKSLIESGR